MSATLNGHRDGEVTENVWALLQARAQRLTARLAAKVDEPTLAVAQFRVGERTFAIPLSEVRAAMPLKRITPVPLSAPQVVGILRHQGRVITTLSLASLVGVKGWRSDPTVLLLVEPAPGRLIGLDCEEVPKPGTLPLRAIEKARAGQSDPVVEIFTSGAATIYLLDVGALLQRGGWSRHGR
jgi:chemotaxis signal transduction protein